MEKPKCRQTSSRLENCPSAAFEIAGRRPLRTPARSFMPQLHFLLGTLNEHHA
jgi:hypothetical protein